MIPHSRFLFSLLSYSSVGVVTVSVLVGVLVGAVASYGLWLWLACRVGRVVDRSHWFAFGGCVLVVFGLLLFLFLV